MANDSDLGQIGSAAITTFGNYAGAVAANKRQFKYQQRAMAQQQAYNKELWDYQNAYNTPQAQMERYEAAGLNPHLIYGSGAGASGNAGPISPTEVPSQQAAKVENVPDIMMRHLQIKQMDAQYKATLQATQTARINAMLTQANIGLKNLETISKAAKTRNAKALAEAEKTTAEFVAKRSKELYENEISKGNLLDQLHGFRNITNPITQAQQQTDLRVSKQALKGAQQEYDYRTEANRNTITTQRLQIEFDKNRNALAKVGVYSSDNPVLRVLIQAANRSGLDVSDLLAKGIDKLEYLFDKEGMSYDELVRKGYIKVFKR